MMAARIGKPITILTALLLLATLTASTTVALFAAATVTVSVDKPSYLPGQTLEVSGTVSPVTAGQDVAIIVTSPTGEIKAVAQATPGADGRYSKAVMAFAPTDPSGAWVVKASYQGIVASASFTYTGVPPRTSISLKVDVSTGRLYFTNETADIYVLTSYDGNPLDANVTAQLYASGKVSALALSKVGTGLYMASYKPAADAKAGTYTVVANATVLTAKYSGSGIGMSSFELSQGMASLNTALNSVKSSVGDVKKDTASILGKFPITIDLSPMWAAVVLSLIAAIAAIYSTITVQRKIAG